MRDGEHPAGDARVGRHAPSDEILLAGSGHGGEDELVALLVEEHDRGRARSEDRPRHLDHRPQQVCEVVLGRQHAGSHRRMHPVRVVGHVPEPPTFVEMR